MQITVNVNIVSLNLNYLMSLGVDKSNNIETFFRATLNQHLFTIEVNHFDLVPSHLPVNFTYNGECL